MFVRLTGALEHTGTFKQRKLELAREGFDPARIAEPIYFDDPERGAYVRLTRELYAQIASDPRRV